MAELNHAHPHQGIMFYGVNYAVGNDLQAIAPFGNSELGRLCSGR